jgi:multidrug efflux pump subunit AcrA (membrane-fusion protein)
VDTQVNKTSLFRTEAVTFQSTRLQGEVLLVIRPRWWVVGILFFFMLVLFICSMYFISYSHKVEVIGQVFNLSETANFTSIDNGVVLKVLVKDGQLVKAGDEMIVLNFPISPQRSKEPQNKFNLLSCNKIKTGVDLVGSPFELELVEECVLLAPKDMIVALVAVRPNESVMKGQNLIGLTSDNDRFQVELIIKNIDVGFIKSGQLVSIKYGSSVNRNLVIAKGKISAISLTPYQFKGAAEPLSTDSFYRATVELDHNISNLTGQQIYLRSGMQVNAEVVLYKYSLLKWIFESLLGDAKA